MNTLAFLVRFAGGLAVGIFFYWGLWFTVNRLATSRYRALLLISSFGIRTLVVLSGFLLLIERRWDYALLCLIGFAMGRIVVMKLMVGRQARAKCT
jgi:F1F0 ATPase subunit 2